MTDKTKSPQLTDAEREQQILIAIGLVKAVNQPILDLVERARCNFDKLSDDAISALKEQRDIIERVESGERGDKIEWEFMQICDWLNDYHGKTGELCKAINDAWREIETCPEAN